MDSAQDANLFDHSARAAAPYQVLARKYRPQDFSSLIGQDAMVRTLRNAFATGRIAHAYVLTGVRGVGKTTTARIVARALNYVAPDGEDRGPTIDMPVEGRHCRAIAEGRHPDVIEIDAASHTGVENMRDLIDQARYGPMQARYKIYIIDEVHMLSTNAFNALLKTLEEPPAHVKFLMATTEIRKLPLTVLSRCQRFDLRRLDPELLVAHLEAIVEKEGASVEPEALAMIARAAEGSVRDALSILDQALVQRGISSGADTAPIDAAAVRTMLGLADRSGVWDLMQSIFSGEPAKALAEFQRQHELGTDPEAVLSDLLNVTHLVARTKAAGSEAASHGPAGSADAPRARDFAARLSMGSLTRAWSILLKGLQETQIAPDPAAAAEIAIIKLIFAADLPTPDEALRRLGREAGSAGATGGDAAAEPRPAQSPRGGPSAGSASAGLPETVASEGATQISAPETFSRSPARATIAPVPVAQVRAVRQQPERPRLQSFADVVRQAAADRDARLRVELESYVRLIAFEYGRIELRLEERAPADLPGRLMQRLKEWTGVHWSIVVNSTAAGADTLRDVRTAETLAHPLVREAMALFPAAEVVAIRDRAAGGPPADDDGDILPDAGAGLDPEASSSEDDGAIQSTGALREAERR